MQRKLIDVENEELWLKMKLYCMNRKIKISDYIMHLIEQDLAIYKLEKTEVEFEVKPE